MRLSGEDRGRIRRLRREGLSFRQIGAEMGRSLGVVCSVLATDGAGRRRVVWSAWEPASGRLSLAEREEIALGLARGESLSGIARQLGRAPSTVSREVNANGGRNRYRASKAHQRAFWCARRPKTAKLVACPELRAVVEAWLEEWWSPQQIALRLHSEFPDDPRMWVSHETIYQSLFVQGRGALRRELYRCLRSGRCERRPPRNAHGGMRATNMVSITERPAEVADRAVPGHWEGDLLMGKSNRSAVGVLVERTTRYVMLFQLPKGPTAEDVRIALTATVLRLPAHLRGSLTWDQGKEMAQHRQFTIDTGIQIYFCDPHAPWQRATAENTNGLLRQYMPKGTDLSVHSQADLDRIAYSLNNRPRQSLNIMKPSEKLTELLAVTG